MHSSHCQGRTSLRKSKQPIRNEQQHQLLTQLARAEEEAQHYQHKFYQMKSINRSIIAAIKRTFSLEAGEQLQKLIQETQELSGANQQPTDPIQLTNTFCQKIITYGSKLVSQPSQQHLPFRPNTPKKIDFSPQNLHPNHCPKLPLSPFLSKSNNKKVISNNDSIKLEMGDFSTRRSYTPVKSSIATQILCELCERVFPPNQFVNHAQRCKYELQYVQTENDSLSTKGGKSKTLEVNYDKMMKNLLKIREQIEEQIRLIAASREEVDRVSLRKNLQKDLKKVMKVINQKQQQIKRKKPNQSQSSKLKKLSKMR